MKKIFKKPVFWFILILLLAIFLRFFRLTKSPPSLNWDETAIGYNAYSILKTGRDEWGVKLPLLGFESFGEYKLPVFIYAMVPTIKMFGLNAFGVRFMPALFGVIGVLLTYLLVKELFKNKPLALISSFLLATSLWHLQITRVAFEAGLAQFFIILTILFLAKMSKKWYFLPLAALMACLAVYTYNSSRIFIPLFFIVAFLLSPKRFFESKKGLILTILIIIIFAAPLLLRFNEPVVQGRYKLISIQNDAGFVLRINDARGNLLEKNWPSFLARAIHNKGTHYLWEFGQNYLAHFSPRYLFLTGAGHSQHSIPGFGQILVMWLPFFVLGVGVFLKKIIKKPWPAGLILAQILISPVAASTTNNAIPHALRTFCSLPAWQILIALGLWQTWSWLKNKKSRKVFLLGLFVLFLINFGFYFYDYHWFYPQGCASDWQYGYKQAIDYVWKNKDDYDKVFFSRDYGEPYIFFLFHSQYNPSYYQSIDKKRVHRYDWVWVDQFDKFYFPDFSDKGSSVQEIRQQYQGKLLFVGLDEDIPNQWRKQTIHFPDGKIAYEIGVPLNNNE